MATTRTLPAQLSKRPDNISKFFEIRSPRFSLLLTIKYAALDVTSRFSYKGKCVLTITNLYYILCS